MILVCRSGRGCALCCQTVMRSKSEVLEKFASAAPVLIGRIDRRAHIPRTPFSQARGVLALGEMEGMFVW